jgi:EAL domain-containing protein (putative c-di-GMP-specific phosphodiesterase class I)
LERQESIFLKVITMSLESLVRQLNAEFATATWRSTQRCQPLQVEQGRVIGHFRGLCLRSSFVRIVDLSGGLLGYQAQLQVDDRQQRPLPSWVPYAMACLEDQAVISLDRLCRTLHALNGLAHAASGWLLLDVHPRHVQEVRQGHGHVFEHLLRCCGLQPRQIVLRFQVAETIDLSHLGRSLERFRSRGFAIALVHPGDTPLNQFEPFLDLAPDFIHIERPRRMLAAGELAACLVSQVLRAHQRHCQVLVQGIDSPVQADLAWLAGVDGLQGEYAERFATIPAAASQPPCGTYSVL